MGLDLSQVSSPLYPIPSPFLLGDLVKANPAQLKTFNEIQSCILCLTTVQPILELLFWCPIYNYVHTCMKRLWRRADFDIPALLPRVCSHIRDLDMGRSAISWGQRWFWGVRFQSRRGKLGVGPICWRADFAHNPPLLRGRVCVNTCNDLCWSQFSARVHSMDVWTYLKFSHCDWLSRWATFRFPLRVPDLQKSCSDLTAWQNTNRIWAPAKAADNMPHIITENCSIKRSNAIGRYFGKWLIHSVTSIMMIFWHHYHESKNIIKTQGYEMTRQWQLFIYCQ